MLEVTIKKVSNGYKVRITTPGQTTEYVYRAIDEIVMLEAIGKLIMSKKVYVREN